jgi:hypothetical protein
MAVMERSGIGLDWDWIGGETGPGYRERLTTGGVSMVLVDAGKTWVVSTEYGVDY